MDKQQASRATSYGAIAGLISGLMTAGVILFATTAGTDADRLAHYNDPWLYVDAGLILICSFFIYRKSRVAAVALFAYFLISKIVVTVQMGKAGGILVSLVFLYFYARAIQGAFVWHRLEKAENPDYRVTSRMALLLGVPPLLLLAGVIVFGAYLEVTGSPSTAVQGSRGFSDAYRTELVQHQILRSEDRVEYFYSWGITSILEGGSILTDKEVILYFPEDTGEIAIYALPLEFITSIEKVEDGSLLEDAVYLIGTDDPDAWIQLPLSVEQQGDQKFIQALRRKLAGLET